MTTERKAFKLGLFKRTSAKDKAIRTYYKDYPEIPYISNTRDEKWLESVALFPKQALVPRDNMVRYDDGLLPGHVYLLYWMDKYNGKDRKIPEYFEFEYGIDFDKEKDFLSDNGYWSSDGLTEKGASVINEHHEVIDKRHPVPKRSGRAESGSLVFNDHGRNFEYMPIGKTDFSRSDLNLLSEEIKELNITIACAKKLAHSRVDISLQLDKIDIDACYYEYQPVAGSRKSKYPLVLHYHSIDKFENNDPNEFWGEIKYLSDGRIGDARMIFWKRSSGYQINIRTSKGKTFVHDFQTVIATVDDAKWIYKYKAQ